ncbi:MAG: oxidoreductase, partial [Solirubrobacterales bacterium]|nr:oxidoreductase [Solirubrobacterales bacterium]
MRAIVVTEHGGPEVLRVQELPDPVASAGDVLIRVKAFGLNHADTYMRSGIWPFGIPVLGIEAAGTVESDPSGG